MEKGIKHNQKLNAVDQLQQRPTEFLIAGIGASAGGIQALMEFFGHVPHNSNIAFVVILHLSPDHDSKLAEVLQSVAKIPVVRVDERIKIQPDHVYIVPPNQHLKMDRGHIAVLPNLHLNERRAPIDIFFRTMAEEHGPRSISVILSGTGANGSMGLKRIKERGGACFVQNPREAEFNEMPRNAIATELIDEVLNVSEIPERIIAYRNSINTVHISEQETSNQQQQQALREIFTQLRVRTGHDFSNYKKPTLLRRIERRINVHNLPDLLSYNMFIKDNPEETQALLKDLLISVTNFFRDKTAFAHLEEKVLPQIFQGKDSSDQVRIWVAGCATGEEAYSLAMLCTEQLSGMLDVPRVQIFATDIDDAAIATAREGLYTLNDAADVSSERLKRFFVAEADGYRVRREIREMVLFANHNFLKDPPFSKLDLATCRNVLIYLNSTAQKRVIETFHFAIKPKGFLFLGTSESIDGANDLYSVYDRDNHVYQTREVGPRSYPVPDSIPHTMLTKTGQQKGSPTDVERISFGELHQKMLEQYAPPSVVINEAYEIVHMSERAGIYFEFSGGELTKNLLKLIRPEIRIEMRAALFQAVQNKVEVEARNLKVIINGQQSMLDILLRPVLEGGDAPHGFILVIFKPGREMEQEGDTVLITSDEPMVQQLEKELIGLKTQLRNSIEQHEYQAEELKASNEELQAMNEELRSAAEELETSKEELQSINEELRTVNQELKVKVEETNLNSNNLQNLINSSDVGTIFLDRNFTIRLFTPAVLEIFNLKAGDYGRPITDITSKLQYEGLPTDAERVLEKLTTIERELATNDGRFFLMRVLPYRTAEDHINGIVITFFDITARRMLEEAQSRSEAEMRLLIESAKDHAIFTIDPSRNVITWSSGATLILGYSETDMRGKSGDVFFLPEDRSDLVPEKEIQNAQADGRSKNERWYLRRDGSRFWGSGITQPLNNSQGITIGYVKIMRDLTAQKELEESLRQSEQSYKLKLESEVDARTLQLKESQQQYATLVANTPDMVSRWDNEFKLLFANKAFEVMPDVPIRMLLNKSLTEMKLPESFEGPYSSALHKTFAGGEIVEHFYTISTAQGEAYYYSRMTPEWGDNGQVLSVLSVSREITEIKKVEIEMMQNRDLLQSILDNSLIAMSVLKPVRDEEQNILDFEITLVNRELRQATQRNDLVGKCYAEEFPGIRSAGLYDVMLRVMATGQPEGLEYFYPYEGLDKWYSCVFVKMDDGLVASNTDISERKISEEKIRKSEEQLRMFINASSDLIYKMNADWSVMFTLESNNLLLNVDSPTENWMERYIPIEERSKVKAAIDQAISSKNPFSLEHMLILSNGKIGWASSRAVPLINAQGEVTEWFGIATDITDRKSFDQEKEKNYLLLKQSEDLASTGTWEYDLLSNNFIWSDGMYRIFNLNKGVAVTPEIYLDYATLESKATAGKIVVQIKNGNSDFEETLTIKVGDDEKAIRLKAIAVVDDRGVPIRVLGVDIDETASRIAVEKIKQMEAQLQFEVSQVTLSTQEEERRRISESLHNGLGQLLYGTRLAMNYLTLDYARDSPKKFNESREYTTELLTNAIIETRRISHELMPVTLSEFGLSTAINEIGEQLTSDIIFNCQVNTGISKLDDYLELAVFRTVQELMVNVAKHSQATHAKVIVQIEGDEVAILVTDNGKGISQEPQEKPGIGLISIRNKVDLLRGNIEIRSGEDQGTEIEVRFPLSLT